VISAKNNTSSNGLLTGVLNLTIERAPIMPRDKAMLLDINVVIIEVIHGKRQKVKVWWYVLTHLCLANESENLKEKPKNIAKKFSNKNSKYE